MNIVDFVNIDYRKTLCFTGHRPKKLASYDSRHPENLKMLLKLRALICRFIEKRGVTTFVSGMALGIDMWSAQIVLALKEKKYPHIKLVCAIPCDKQYSKWSKSDTEIYHEILEEADIVYYVSKEPYTNWCMHDRDKWMVDNSNFVLAVWNGERVKGSGTWITVDYALKRQRPIMQLHPKTLKIDLISA